MHARKRLFILSQLSSFDALFSQLPNAVAPHLQIILAVVALARDEVIWFFEHMGASPPKSKAKFKEGLFVGGDISELLFLIYKLTKLLKDRSQGAIFNMFLCCLLCFSYRRIF